MFDIKRRVVAVGPQPFNVLEKREEVAPAPCGISEILLAVGRQGVTRDRH